MNKQHSILSVKSGFSVVNGLMMHYEIHGTGSPLVLIHGGGSTIKSTFGRILPLLAVKRQIIAVELQAHGLTEDRNTPLSFEQDANDVAALLQNLDITKADILGFSNGGQTALKLAITHPGLVRKLIVVSAFYRRDGTPQGFFDGMKSATPDTMPSALKKAYLEEVKDEGKFMTMFRRDKERMLNFTDWSDSDIKSISAPTLLVAGDADVVLPEHAVALFRLIPHCRLAILPGEHGTVLGDIATLNNGEWTQQYLTPLFEQFLDSENQ
jgi:pimeloyl-ACP methyl ester carboxylesterase